MAIVKLNRNDENQIAERFECPVVIENLDFTDAKQEWASNGVKYRRMLSGFAYRTFASSLDSRLAAMSKANLSNAWLCHADLSHANLSNADLSDANLRGANLTGANVEDAQFKRDTGLIKSQERDLERRGAKFGDSGAREPLGFSR